MVVTQADFVAELERRAARLPVAPAENEEARRLILDEMIDREAQLARARELGLDQDPAIRRELDSALIRRLQSRELDASLAAIRVEPHEIEAWYDEHGAELESPSRVRAALVKLEISPMADDDVRARRRREADALLEEAKGLAAGFHGFGPVAARVSDHRSSRYKGGDVGWLVKGEYRYRFDPAVLDAIYALETPGEIGPVVEGEDGLYLVMLLGSEAAALPPLGRLSPQIEQKLMQEKKQALGEEWIAGVRRAVSVETDLERLRAIEMPPELIEAPEVAAPRPPSLPGR